MQSGNEKIVEVSEVVSSSSDEKIVEVTEVSSDESNRKLVDVSVVSEESEVSTSTLGAADHPGAPLRFSSLPKEFQVVKFPKPQAPTYRSLSDTCISYSEPTREVACVPKLSFRRSKPRPNSIQEDESREVEVVSRACRVRVNVIAAKNLRKSLRASPVKAAALKVKVENQSKFFRPVRLGAAEEDGSVKMNQSFTFDIKDPNYAVLSVHVVSKSRFGGEESLGICSEMPIMDLLDRSGDCQDIRAEWFDLFSKRGKKLMPGKILMDIVAGIAEPEHKISVFIGTWNVGNARPAKNLSSWLPNNNEHELVIVGAQECEYPPRPPFTDCGKDWTNSIKTCVGSKYKLIRATSRSQIRLAAFVRDDAEKAISEIDSGSEATGVGHVVANKGAVSIAFKFWDTDLCFVSSHLAAHIGYRELRNGNYREIVENLSIGYQGMDVLSKFHHVFWMGDLNYRLDFGNLEDKTLLTPQKNVWEDVVDLIRKQKYDELIEHDELRKEIAGSRAFHGFREGPIKFAPTFKVQRDELLSYNEKRLPAWCDRVLYRSFDGCNIEPASYFSSPEITTSDHKPVGAIVRLTAYALPCTNLDQDGRKWHIILTSLEAEGLKAADITGYSDPYVSFAGANLIGEFHSKVKYRTLNPVWDPAKDLPKLVVTASSLHRLEHEYLMCHVLDYDFTSANDTLGFGAIPLRGLVAAFKRNPEETAPFKIELLHQGLPAGVLKGGMKLTWERSLVKHKSSLADGLFIRTLTFRKSFKRTFFVREHYQ